MSSQTHEKEILRRGLDALRSELGVAGMLEFIRLYYPGKGDYTAERQEWVDSWTEEQIRAAIERLRAEDKLPSPVESR